MLKVGDQGEESVVREEKCHRAQLEACRLLAFFPCTNMHGLADVVKR